MDAINVLEKLDQTSGKNDKIFILKEHVCNTELKDLLYATFDKKRRFFIKKFNVNSGPQNAANTHNDFMQLLSLLESETIRGNNAQIAVEKFLQTCDFIHAKWYSRVIKKDLKAGFSISTANKAGFNIPKFEVQLATDGKKCKKLKEIIKKGVSGSPKLDGYRCFSVIEDGNVTLYSRNGEILSNFTAVEESLKKLFPKGRYCFDGEIMSDDFNKMQQSAFASKRKTTVGDVIYNIFDNIPYDEWKSNDYKMTAFTRYDNLKIMMEEKSNEFPDNIRIVNRFFINDLDVAIKLERQLIADGFEGLMINQDIPYYLGKKGNKMLKMKTMLSMDCEVLSAHPGQEGKYENTLGKITVIQENGIQCNVGSGFCDSERDEIWNNFKDYKGRIVEVKYQELTPDGVMRFPVLKKWRTDKD